MKPLPVTAVAAAILATAGLPLGALGCGSRCAEVAAARDALAQRRGAPDRGADLRIALPLARADALFAESLAAQPLQVALAPPSLDLGLLQLAVPGQLVARAQAVRLLPAPPERLRFAIALQIADGDEGLVSLATEVEVAPVLQRRDGGAELSMRFGLENLARVTPVLDADASAKLGRAVLRWAPAALRDHLPRPVVDRAAKELAEYLSGAAYRGLRQSLLSPMGELTRLRLRLPDVPVAKLSVRTSDEALVIEVQTELPVRRGLPAPSAAAPAATSAMSVPSTPSAASAASTAAAAAAAGASAGDLRVSLSPSASAELANWAIDRGHLPRWYSRDLRPSAGGEFRPRFDYLAEDAAHPFKVYSFQERGGCSYFRVGVEARVAVDERDLIVTALDRALEAVSANPVVEVAAWTKYFLFGAVDQSKRMAASTRLSVGDRRFESRVVAASLEAEALAFGLALSAAP